METKYNHKTIEAKSYQKWLDEKLFVASAESKKPKFCIVLPPPNITGQLHLGHAWDGTIQDALIRYKRLQGFETLFVPGIDHAGIATQVKVLEEIKKIQPDVWKNLDQKTFFDYAWKWKDKYYQVIHEQWANLGLSLDYTREKFTLDQDVSQAVRKVFVDLYNKKLIYQGTKIVNWDPLLKTAISNIEVNYQEVKGKLYYLKYYLEDKSSYLVVATTRPETMFADQALVVNSKDERYQKFVNKKVINPANQGLIPIISDDYVDVSFATGIMKCTPGHDFNDYQIGLNHKLAMPICLDEAGVVNQLGGKYAGQDRFLCRKNLISDLQKIQLVEKIEEYVHQVGYSERTNVVVEPYLSKQWFINMNPVAQMILKNQADEKDKVDFFPEFFEEQLLKWVNNIQDWCISRQLWWGHRIPVWYHKQTKEVYVGVEAPNNVADYEQETDVLDTWFSSALWPLLTLNWPNEDAVEFKNFYPINVLVTAYDILFFWVVRMMFMGLEFTATKPFQHVLIHGLIRDEQGRKMSKSLNNGIDPIAVIDEYGADALRYFLISNSAPGQDLRFSKIKIEAAWNLINKLWNAARYVLLNLPEDFNYQFDANAVKFSFIDQWVLTELNQLISKVEKSMDEFDFISVSHELSNFIWNQYCSWYIELSKVNLQNKELAVASISTLIYVLKQVIIMLHPFLPFVTEEIYQKMKYQSSILLENYPKVESYNFECNAEVFVKNLIEIISAVREIRNQFGLAFKTKLDLHIISDQDLFKAEKDQLNKYLLKLTNSEIVSIDIASFTKEKKISKIISNAVVEIKTELAVDKDKELVKFKKQLDKITLEIEKCEILLNNQQFISKAAPEKVKFQQEKLAQNQKQKELILRKIKELS
ncbi:valine--tRNA ligase [Spiroplasma platyhelix]|uniref:Valine--tRNA ligase n=1 Tax=Spiroplasma platyhelix PALS-1 TaxID=1276218 RepID=A0A846TQX1_9MOLU|nr:valine--tRNA ligase [Spiroplasma platyhelix]MBE4704368.1 Valine--tRNA ligase [Spiroplasma platyhelix PALS-1]NKE38740.1 valine--tRNA ligase [Spiroplasma platyhelix PALS-1]UJB28951.1 valyl-tRNA synthetase [Spiroplasma platyhelix PALS-1]